MASITIKQIARTLTGLTDIDLVNGYLEGDDFWSGDTASGSYKVQLSLLKDKFNEGAVTYVSAWNASTGFPPSLTPIKGQYWVVSVSGNTDLSGIFDWQVKDWAIYNGTTWDKVDNSDQYIESWGVKYLNTLYPTISNVEEALDLTFSGLSSLSTSIDSGLSYAIGAIDSLSTVVSSGVSQIYEELSTIISIDFLLSTAISIETSDRISGDTSLSTSISTISGNTFNLDAIMVDGDVLGLVGGELTGVTYSTVVSAEASIRASADTSLSTAISGKGDVFKVGTPLDNQVGVWTGDGTIEGTTGLTYNGIDLLVDGNVLGYNTRKISKIILISGSTTTWDMENSSSAEVTISGSTTLNILNVVSGDNGTLLIIQQGIGTLSYPSGSRFIGGSPYTLTGDGKIDILSFYFDGTKYYWNIGKDYYEITP